MFSKIIGGPLSNNKNSHATTREDDSDDSDLIIRYSVQYYLSMKWGKSGASGSLHQSDWLVTGDHLQTECGMRDG